MNSWKLPDAPLDVATPALFSVRVSRNIWLFPGKLIPPFAFVTPWVDAALHGLVAHIDPPDHVNSPVIVSVPGPVSTPPLRFVAPCTVLAPFSVSVPPVTFRTLANVDTPVTVSGPDVKVIVELATKLAMVWLAAARPPIVMVELVKPVPIHTLSAAIGNVPLLQL